MKKNIQYFFRLIKELFCFRKIDNSITFDFSQKDKFNVMTFNIRRDTPNDKENCWKFRRDSIIEMIQEYEPDIICFQEVMPTMARFLIHKLGNYYDNSGVEVFTNREISKSCLIFGEGLLTMWRKDLFLREKKKNVVKLFDGRIINLRRFMDIELIHKETKEKIHVINTHFCHLNKTTQNKSFAKLDEYVSKLNTRLYICGDFNCDKTYRNTDINIMMDKFSYNYKHQPSDGSMSFFGKKSCNEVVDYIFSNNDLEDFEIITKKYNNKCLSDHYAIINTYKNF